MLHVNPFKQIGFLLFSLAGLFIFVQIVGAIVGSAYAAAHPGITQEEYQAYMQSGEGLFSLDIPAYLLLFACMSALLFADWKPLLKSFTKWKSYIYGVLGFFSILAFTMLYSAIVSAIYRALGRETPTEPNLNQIYLNRMILFNPAVCAIVFGVVGPFTEELGYRVGLFGLASRLGKVLGYVLSTIVFALIHFDFNCFSNPVSMEIEFVNLPMYLFSGFAFAFLYAKGGFPASFTAHVINNVVSVIENYARMTNGA